MIGSWWEAIGPALRASTFSPRSFNFGHRPAGGFWPGGSKWREVHLAPLIEDEPFALHGSLQPVRTGSLASLFFSLQSLKASLQTCDAAFQSSCHGFFPPPA